MGGFCEVGEGFEGIASGSSCIVAFSWMEVIESVSERPEVAEREGLLEGLRDEPPSTRPPWLLDEAMLGVELEGLRDTDGVPAAGVAGPNCPWSNMCSRAASSCLKKIHRYLLIHPV